MKKLILAILVLTLLVSGCTPADKKEDLPMPTEVDPQPESTAPESTESTGDSVIIQQDMTAVSLPVVKETLTDKDGTVLFTYQGQSMNLVVADPGVADKILIDFFTQQDKFRAASEDIKSSAKDNTTGTPMFYDALFAPARIDMNVLSLQGAVVFWSGGSRPSYSAITANYSMVNGDKLTLGGILTHENQADALCKLLIDSITKVKSDYAIWDDFESEVKNRFSGNISEDELWFFDETGINFCFHPGTIASALSGIITVNVPYSDLVGIIEGDYFPVEQAAATGKLNIKPLGDGDTQQFSQIAEIVTEENSDMVLLYTDEAITDVTIQLDHTHTVFATAALTPGDAIMLEADLTGHIVVVNYTSAGQSHSRYIQWENGTATLLEDIPE